jgi:hypothetical protein
MRFVQTPIILAVVSLGLLLAACASTPPVVSPPAQVLPPIRTAPPKAAVVIAPVAVATPGLTAKQRVKLAIDLLAAGDPVHARPEIDAFLAEQPGNELGKNLLAQITQDPKALLGAESFSYTIQSGETLSILAERFLDDRFKFYALARYNGISIPAQAEVGRVIQIPGTARKLVEARPRASTKSDEDLLQAQLEAKRNAPTPKPAVVARNTAKANELRGAALELMSRGGIDRAVALLRQALTFDPGNPVIQRDLDRALRIMAGVRPAG